jgi:soluble lytic murein transglycosylase-like protein
MTPAILLLIKLHSVADPSLVAKVIEVESSGGHAAVSDKGATGLMQVTNVALKEVERNTARLPAKCKLIPKDANLLNPATNVLAGSCYLRLMISTFDGDVRMALAAYNAGPARVREHINTGRELPPETVAYLDRFGEFYASQTK